MQQRKLEMGEPPKLRKVSSTKIVKTKNVPDDDEALPGSLDGKHEEKERYRTSLWQRSNDTRGVRRNPKEVD